ncbi:hypothetical protein N7526_010863 [Penicillium atrosanguineum]|nr:hypothetical protein N7526_010863 [Penicillium atrosanguineum]
MSPFSSLVSRRGGGGRGGRGGSGSFWPFPYTDQDGNPRLPRTHAEGIQSLIQYAERPGGNQGQLQLPVGGDELARMCTTPVQLAILRGRGRPIWHVRGNINGQQIVSQRPSYINALLIQSRGNQLVQPCEAVSDSWVSLAAVVAIVSGVITYLGALYEIDSPAMLYGYGHGTHLVPYP